MQTHLNLPNDWLSWLYLLGMVAAFLLASRIVHYVIAFLNRRLPAQKSVWLHAFWAALDKPLQLVIWLLGLGIVSYHILPQSSAAYFKAIEVLLVLSVGWFAWRFVKQAQINIKQRALLRGDAIDPTASDAISKLCCLLIAILVTLSLLQIFGLSISGLLAFGGVAGIAVGFAAQSLVANLLGGLTVFASRIFKIGEYIILPDSNLMGEVQHIGWRATTVMGFDRKPFYIPNAVFNTSTVINHSRMTHRRIEEFMYLRYEDASRVDAIVKAGNQWLSQYPDIDQSFFVFRFDSYSDRALKLLLYAFTSNDYTKYMQVKQELLLAMAQIVSQHGAQLFSPTSSIHVSSDSVATPAE